MLYYLGPWFEANEIVKQVLYDVGIFGLLGMRFAAVTVASICTIPYRKLNLFVTAIVLYAAWTNVNTLRLNLWAS